MPALRKRYASAMILLLLMAVNFTAEGVSLYLAHSARLFPDVKVAVCSVADSSAESKPSCCAASKVKTTCGCPHCGDSCPMGDACTCNHDGKPTRRAEGMFFRVPGCHPEQDQHDSSYLPLSMRVIYLAADAPAAVSSDLELATLAQPNNIYTGHTSAPPVPPPRSAAA